MKCPTCGGDMRYHERYIDEIVVLDDGSAHVDLYLACDNLDCDVYAWVIGSLDVTASHETFNKGANNNGN